MYFRTKAEADQLNVNYLSEKLIRRGARAGAKIVSRTGPHIGPCFQSMNVA